MEKTFQQRNATNMKELFDLLLKPRPREAYITREAAEQYAEGYLAGFVDALTKKEE